MATPFNIRAKQIQETARLHLRDPETDIPLYADAKETLPLEILVAGKASKAYRNAVSELSRKAAGRNGKATFEQNVEANNKLLATVCQEAFNFDMGDGVPINTTEKFVELFSEPSLYWCKDQVSAFLEENSSFLGK